MNDFYTYQKKNKNHINKISSGKKLSYVHETNEKLSAAEKLIRLALKKAGSSDYDNINDTSQYIKYAEKLINQAESEIRLTPSICEKIKSLRQNIKYAKNTNIKISEDEIKNQLYDFNNNIGEVEKILDNYSGMSKDKTANLVYEKNTADNKKENVVRYHSQVGNISEKMIKKMDNKKAITDEAKSLYRKRLINLIRSRMEKARKGSKRVHIRVEKLGSNGKDSISNAGFYINLLNNQINEMDRVSQLLTKSEKNIPDGMFDKLESLKVRYENSEEKYKDIISKIDESSVTHKKSVYIRPQYVEEILESASDDEENSSDEENNSDENSENQDSHNEKESED